MVIELLLISVGVFLGLAGDQWRENAEHRAQARATLRRFRSEIVANRASLAAVADYRTKLLGEVRAYLSLDHRTRNVANVHAEGLRMVQFEQTAWDLAVATQSLTYLEPGLAADLSRVYNRQGTIAELNRAMSQSMYQIQWRENFDALAGSVDSFFGDLVVFEPELIRLYDDILPKIDKSLGT